MVMMMRCSREVMLIQQGGSYLLLSLQYNNAGNALIY